MARYAMPGGDPRSRIQMGMRRTVLAGPVTPPEERARILAEGRRRLLETDQATANIQAGDVARKAEYDRRFSPPATVRPGGTTDAYPWLSAGERGLADRGVPLGAIAPRGPENALGVGPNQFSAPPVAAAPVAAAPAVPSTPFDPERARHIIDQSARRAALVGHPQNPAGSLVANAPGEPSTYVGTGGAGPDAARNIARREQLTRGLIQPGQEPLSPAQFSERTLGFSGDLARENIRRRNLGGPMLTSQGALDETRAQMGAETAGANLAAAGARAMTPLQPRAAEAAVGGAEAGATMAQAQADIQQSLAAGMRAIPAGKLAQAALGISPGEAQARSAEISTSYLQAAAELEATDPEAAKFLRAAGMAHAQGALPEGMAIEVPDPGAVQRALLWIKRKFGIAGGMAAGAPLGLPGMVAGGIAVGAAQEPGPQVVQVPSGAPGAGMGPPATREDIQQVIAQFQSALGRKPSEQEVRDALARRGLFEPVPGGGVVQPQATLSVRG